MGFPIFGSTGMTHWDREKTFPGVTVYTTFGSDHVNLVDMKGKVVHTWTPPMPVQPYYGVHAAQRQHNHLRWTYRSTGGGHD